MFHLFERERRVDEDFDFPTWDVCSRSKSDPVPSGPSAAWKTNQNVSTAPRTHGNAPVVCKGHLSPQVGCGECGAGSPQVPVWAPCKYLAANNAVLGLICSRIFASKVGVLRRCVMEKVLGMIMWKEGLFPPLGAFFTFNGERPRRAHLVPAPVHAGNVYSKAHCRAQPVPNPWGSTHTLGGAQWKGKFAVGISDRHLPWKTEDAPGQRGCFPGHRGVGRSLGVGAGNLPTGTKGKPSGLMPRCPTPPPHFHFQLLGSGSGEASVFGVGVRSGKGRACVRG